MFYPQEEFDAQLEELIELGFSPEDANQIVRAQMDKDEAEYWQWRDEQDAIHAHDEMERDHDEPYEPELNDSWCEDQYEVDADYL